MPSAIIEPSFQQHGPLAPSSLAELTLLAVPASPDHHYTPLLNDVPLDLAQRDLWWDDPASPAIHYARATYAGLVPYYTREALAGGARGRTLLDFGCKAGELSEEFARLGYAVTGTDPVPQALRSARRHAAAIGLTIRYRDLADLPLPFPDETFDVVLTVDTEHFADRRRVYVELARVLRPRGVFLFVTYNRTRFARFVYLTLVEDWLGLTPPRQHIYELFVAPDVLARELAAVGIATRHVQGMAPRGLVTNLLRVWLETRRTGRSIGRTLADRELPFRPVRSLAGYYAGWGVKS